MNPVSNNRFFASALFLIVALQRYPFLIFLSLPRPVIDLAHRDGMAWHGMAWHGMAWHDETIPFSIDNLWSR